MHTIRSKIEFSRPGYCTELQRRLRKAGRIGQVREYAPEKPGLEANGALKTVNEPHPHRSIASEFHGHDAPRSGITKWRHHGSGAIRPLGIPRLAASQAAINSN